MDCVTINLDAVYDYYIFDIDDISELERSEEDIINDTSLITIRDSDDDSSLDENMDISDPVEHQLMFFSRGINTVNYIQPDLDNVFESLVDASRSHLHNPVYGVVCFSKDPNVKNMNELFKLVEKYSALTGTICSTVITECATFSTSSRARVLYQKLTYRYIGS